MVSTSPGSPPASAGEENGQSAPEAPIVSAWLIPVITPPPELLRFYGWQPFQVWSSVAWCGHPVEGIPMPGPDGRWRLIPILGETT